MAKKKNNYAVSFVINVRDSASTKKQLEKLAADLVNKLQAGFDARLTSGTAGNCSLSVDNLADSSFAPPSQAMTWQQLEESIGDQMDEFEQPTDPRDPIPIRMSDGNPLAGAERL